MQRQSDKLSKLATIKGILNGTLSIKDLQPQKIYFVNIRGKGDVYEISETGRDCGKGKQMSKDEFEKWKAENYRKGIDVLFIMDLSDKSINEPLKEYKPQITKEPEMETIPEPVTQEPVFKFPVLKPINKAIKEAKEPDVKKIEAKEIIEPEAPKRTFGKLSEYGIIWQCQRN